VRERKNRSEGLERLCLKRVSLDTPTPERTRHARWRDVEGYLSAALAAFLFATPTIARWFSLSSTAIGLPVFYLILVFGLRGVRSHGGGRFAAYVALTLVAVAMIATLVIVTIEIPAWIKDDKHPSR
jgi:hypothetical protein